MIYCCGQNNGVVILAGYLPSRRQNPHTTAALCLSGSVAQFKWVILITQADTDFIFILALKTHSLKRLQDSLSLV